jgi:HSP20 family molecular chaperone IbpA
MAASKKKKISIESEESDNDSLVEVKPESMTESQSSKEELWYSIRPTFYTNLNSINREFTCEIHLPGVDKENVKLKVLPELFDLKAQREHVLYTLTEYFPAQIETEGLETKYENGLLTMKAKLRDPLADAVDIPLQ